MAQLQETTVDGNVFVTGEVIETGNAPVSGTIDLASSDELPEGSSNLYFTTERAQDAAAQMLTAGVSPGTGITGTYSDNVDEFEFSVDLSPFSTDDLSEGSNLYYTDSRARSALSASGDLNYDSGTGTFSVTTYKSSDFDSDFGLKSTDDLSEGSSNLYYTDTRAVSAVETTTLSVLQVDNIRLDGNTISTTNTDGDLIIDTDGSGNLEVQSDTFIDQGHFHIESTYDESATGVVPDSSQGTRFQWIPEYAAFRAGRLTSASPTEWDESNIGFDSFAFGSDNRASGRGSVAIGRDHVLRGDFDSAFGDEHITGAGGNNAGWSFLAGFGNEVTDFVGTAIGWGNTAANVSTALGRGTDATGNYSFASNYFTEASNAYSAAMNFRTIASGNTSFAVGTESNASGNTAFAAGQITNASGILSTAFGYDVDSSGLVSFGFGDESTVSGDFATVFGRGMTVSGNYSFGISLDDLRSQAPNVTQSSTLSIVGGKVGIEVTDPVETFEVFGTMNISGGGILGALTKIASVEVGDLSAGRVVFTEAGSGGAHLIDDADFTYDNTTDTLTVPNIEAGNISTTGGGSTSVNTLQVTDLSQDRIVITGTGGELEYDDNLQFDGSTLTVGNGSNVGVSINGDLTVSGTTTTINTETVSIADNVVLLNSNVSGTPSENGGIEIERGTSTNARILWDESNDVWKVGLNGSESEISLVGDNISQFTNDSGFITDISSFSTDDLSEGSTNLYSQWLENGSSIYYNSGNVGVLTNTPNTALEVNGDITTTDGVIGSMAVRDLTVSTSTPSGGNDGDVWYQVSP